MRCSTVQYSNCEIFQSELVLLFSVFASLIVLFLKFSIWWPKTKQSKEKQTDFVVIVCWLCSCLWLRMSWNAFFSFAICWCFYLLRLFASFFFNWNIFEWVIYDVYMKAQKCVASSMCNVILVIEISIDTASFDFDLCARLKFRKKK